MRCLRIFILALSLVFVPFTQGHASTPTNVSTVERFIAAFNAHDNSAMASLVAADIEWLSIAGQQVTVDTKGKDDLVRSMNAYFESCPSCRSELSGVASTPSRVSAAENASWQAKTGPKSQSGISVDEFTDGMISRAYYFPAEK